MNLAAVIVGSIGLVLMILAATMVVAGVGALKKPLVHDGIGGKDTKNMMTGCLFPFIALGFGISGIVCELVAIGLAVWMP